MAHTSESVDKLFYGTLASTTNEWAKYLAYRLHRENGIKTKTSFILERHSCEVKRFISTTDELHAGSYEIN